MGRGWREAATAARYLVGGLLNTLVGLSLILFLELKLGVAAQMANAAGYAAGWALGYLIARRFVFPAAGEARGRAGRYVLSVLAAFALNQLIVNRLQPFAASGDLAAAAVQVCAICAYTAVLYACCRLWVFRPGEAR